MTKTYIKPETVTVKVEFQQIMAGSPNAQIDPDKEATTNPETGDYNDAKGFSFFFEQEEIETEE
jgi:hypothetical protein